MLIERENLLCYLLTKAVKSRELDIQDSHNNTILHLAVDNRVLSTGNRDFQMFVVQKLLQSGVNPLILNKKKKLASKCVPKLFPQLTERIQIFGNVFHISVKLLIN